MFRNHDLGAPESAFIDGYRRRFIRRIVRFYDEFWDKRLRNDLHVSAAEIQGKAPIHRSDAIELAQVWVTTHSHTIGESGVSGTDVSLDWVSGQATIACPLSLLALVTFVINCTT